MRVLFVTGVFPPDLGGPARYVPAIAGELQARGHDIVSVVTLSDRLDHDDGVYPFPVLRLPRATSRPLRVLRTMWTILRNAMRADVAYLNGLVMEGIVAAKLIARRRTVIKVVGDLIWERARNARATVLDLDAFQAARLPFRWRFLRWLQGWYTARADLVIVPSEYLGSIVRGWGVDPAKVRVIPNAVPLPPAADATPPAFDLVTVARLVPWKGVGALIEIAAANGWSLRIVGDGPLLPELQRTAAATGGNISFAGQVSPERVCAEIRNARIFVLNSSYEGLPHIVLEAKAAGVPVIAAAASGTREVMHHDVDGLLVPVGDSPALAATIRHLLTDDADRERLRDAGRRQIETEYRYAALVDATEMALGGAR